MHGTIQAILKSTINQDLLEFAQARTGDPSILCHIKKSILRKLGFDWAFLGNRKSLSVFPKSIFAFIYPQTPTGKTLGIRKQLLQISMNIFMTNSILRQKTEIGREGSHSKIQRSDCIWLAGVLSNGKPIWEGIYEKGCGESDLLVWTQ